MREQPTRVQHAYDDACIRLARALKRTPETLEAAMQDVGVDAAYLERALLEGDPQGAIGAVGQRLGLTRREMVVALVRAGGVEPGAVARDSRPDDAEALRALFERTLPRALRRAAWGALGLGATLGALAGLAMWRPDAFRAALVVLAAVGAFVGSIACLFLAWRLWRAAARAEELARTRSTKRS